MLYDSCTSKKFPKVHLKVCTGSEKGGVPLWTVVGCEKGAVLSLLKSLKKLILISVK